MREGESNGALQFSSAEYRGGKLPDATESDLVTIVSDMFRRMSDDPRILTTSSGACAFGTFASAEGFTNTVARARFWAITNGEDFVFVTFISTVKPSREEWQESRDIALRTILGFHRPWWKFWARA